MHPILSAGTHLLRLGPRRVQLGLHPDRRIVLDETPAVAGALAVLTGRAPEDTLDPALLARLQRLGLAVGEDAPLRRALPQVTPGSTWARHAVAALSRRVGEDLDRAMAGRASVHVEVVCAGHPRAHDLGADLAALCTRSGLATRPSPTSRAVVALVVVGEPDRLAADALVRAGRPHLVVRLVEGRAVIGPFVEPGRTACLRCTDAHRAVEEPWWPVLLEQYARASAQDRADGIPEPLDPALAAVTVGWAARELATYAEGGVPTTRSATVELSPLLDTVAAQPWPPHPACGCGW